MANVALKQMFARPDHALWVLTQQFAVRGMIALKFLLAARLLGPEQIGLVGIALLSLAIVESLSDTGLSQAVVQSHSKISRQEAGAVWTLQLTRGVVLAVLLFALSGPISLMFRLPAATSLIALAAAIPLLRNAFNPGIFLVQRDRNFRQLSLFEASAALLDIATTLLLINLGFGPASILLGNIANDSLKLVSTWTWCRTPLTPNFQWSLIRALTSFGKWVWGSSIIIMILNQLDKVLVARFLGTTEFGLYQVASRIAQLFVADGAAALAQYLYPTFAQNHRASLESTKSYLGWVIRRLVLVATFIVVILIIMAGSIIKATLGIEWVAATPILQVLAVAMFFSALNTVFVAYSRATGRPKIVTLAVTIQLLALVAVGPVLVWKFGSIGMASASALALVVASAYFAATLTKKRR